MKTTAWKQIRNFLKDEEGATAVEYGVLVAMIIAVCIVAISGIGKSIGEAFSDVDEKIVAAKPAVP